MNGVTLKYVNTKCYIFLAFIFLVYLPSSRQVKYINIQEEDFTAQFSNIFREVPSN